MAILIGRCEVTSNDETKIGRYHGSKFTQNIFNTHTEQTDWHAIHLELISDEANGLQHKPR